MTTDPRQLDPDRLAAEARSLRALARAAAGGGVDGDDLAQEAWLTALQRPPEPGFSLRAWLGGIVRNHARDAQRTARRRAVREEHAARPEAVDLDDTVERLDLLRHLLAEARALEEPFRAAILLRYVDGLSTEAIARRLGVPAGTVRARLHRGLERLRARLDKTVPGGRAAWLVPFSLYLPTPGAVAGVAAPAGVAGTLLPTTAALTLVMTLKKTLAALVVMAVVGIGAVALWPDRDDAGAPGRIDPTPSRAETRSGDARAGLGTEVDADSGSRVEVPASEVVAEGASTASEGPFLLIRGLVRAARDGAPVPGAEVTVGLRRSKDDAALAKIFSSKAVFAGGERLELVSEKTESDADGRFEVRLPLAAGGAERSHAVYASARRHGYVYSRVEADSEPGSAVLEVDLDLPAGARIAGRVLGPLSEALAGAEVWTRKPSQFPARTDAEGGFVLDDVDPRAESYGLRAAADGFLPQVVQVPRDDGRYPDDVVIHLARGASVEGSVFAGGQPLGGAGLRILAGKDILLADSAADGRYRFAAVPAGRWKIEAKHESAPTVTETIEVPECGPDGAVVRHDVFLELGRALRGNVLSRDGRALAAAEVVVMRHGNVLRGTATDEAGGFVLDGLPLEPLTVRAHAPGFRTGVVEEVPVGQEVVELRLEVGAGFAFTVVDAVSGAPVPDFEVRIWEAEGEGDGFRMPLRPWQAVHDAQGRYVTDAPDFEAGQVAHLEIRSEGYATTHLPRGTAEREPDPQALRVAMEIGAELTAHVVDADGRPVEGASVELLLEDGVPWSQFAGFDRLAKSDAEGAFVVEHVPSGTHRLRLQHEQHGDLLHSFEVPEGARECRESLRFAAGAELSGFVRAPTGEFVADVPVVLLRLDAPSGSRSSWKATSSVDGSFSIAQLPAGEFELQRIEKQDEAPAGKPLPLFSIPVTLRGGEAREVDLAPRGAGRIEGRLIADEALPETVYLRLEPLDELAPTAPGMRRFPRWLRATNGAITVPFLLAGRYRLSAVPGAAGNLVGEVEVEVGEGTRSEIELRLAPRDG